MGRILIPVLALVCLAGAAEQNRKWQEGKLVSMEKTKELEGMVTNSNTEGKVKPNGKTDKYSEHSTSMQTANYDDYMIYVIDAGEFTYTAKQKLNFPWSKSANLSVGDSFKFAVQRDKIYLLDDDGKEFSAKVVKKAMKGAQ